MMEPRFIDGPNGRLFALFFDAGAAAKDAVVYLPPFAEEMNRCRALASQQARRLALSGTSCLLLDPCGTGDSSGDLDQVTWDDWIADTRSGAQWLAERTGLTPSLWGCRLGALLAGTVFEATPEAFNRLLLWQPVTNGKQFLTQYLRLRVAWLMERGLPAETTDDMRAQMLAGVVIEVAGYPLSGALATGLDQARFPTGNNELKDKHIFWFEHGAKVDSDLSIAAQRAVDQLRARGATVDAHTFTGAPLWQLHKRDEQPELIEATMSGFGAGQ